MIIPKYVLAYINKILQTVHKTPESQKARIQINSSSNNLKIRKQRYRRENKKGKPIAKCSCLFNLFNELFEGIWYWVPQTHNLKNRPSHFHSISSSNLWHTILHPPLCWLLKNVNIKLEKLLYLKHTWKFDRKLFEYNFL